MRPRKVEDEGSAATRSLISSASSRATLASSSLKLGRSPVAHLLLGGPIGYDRVACAARPPGQISEDARHASTAPATSIGLKLGIAPADMNAGDAERFGRQGTFVRALKGRRLWARRPPNGFQRPGLTKGEATMKKRGLAAITVASLGLAACGAGGGSESQLKAAENLLMRTGAAQYEPGGHTVVNRAICSSRGHGYTCRMDYSFTNPSGHRTMLETTVPVSCSGTRCSANWVNASVGQTVGSSTGGTTFSASTVSACSNIKQDASNLSSGSGADVASELQQLQGHVFTLAESLKKDGDPTDGSTAAKAAGDIATAQIAVQDGANSISSQTQQDLEQLGEVCGKVTSGG